tara:strand:+ start:3983 stop:6370 length:2388 start_codon:yes stop_codon:yes gene_type:complete
MRIPKNLSKIQVQPPAPKRQRLAKALVGRKRDKLNNTAGETSGNSSNSAMNNRPTPKRKKITSATRSTVRQIPQPAFRTAAMGAAAKERNIEKKYANLVNQRNALPSGYKAMFVNKLLLNTAKNGDKAVKLIQSRMRETVAKGLDRYKNLRKLTKKLSPNGQKKFTNNIKNNLSVARHMVIKNAISKEIKREANAKVVREKAANEKKRANTVINSAIKQRRANAKKVEEKAKAAKEKAIANAKEVIRARQQKEANDKAAKEKAEANKVLNSAIQQRRANAKKAAENAKKAKENANKAATAVVAKSSPKIKNMTNENLIRVLGKNASIIEKTDKKMPYGKQASRNLLLETINDIKNPTGSARTEGAKQYLRFLYGAGLSDTRLTKIKEIKTRDVQMRILRQFTALRRMIVAVPNKTLKINLDEDGTLDFLFLMWCDMLHDKTVDDSVSFQNFLNGDAVRMLFPGTSGIKFAPTIFIKSLVTVAGAGNIFVFSRDVNNRVFDLRKAKTTPYEADWKEAMTQGDIPIEKTNITNRRPRITKQIIAETAFKLNSIRPRINKEVYISIDQEGVAPKEFSKIIDASKNGTVYRLGSIVGYANLFDAGVEMVTKGKQQDRIQSRAWGMMNDPRNVKFMMNYYSPLFQVEINGRGKNRSNNRNTNMSANFGFGEYENKNGEIKFILNGGEIKPSRGAKKKAQKTGDPSQQLIKFMGDFMQVLTALHAQTFGGGRMLYVPASGDGMFVVIYMYLARKLGLVPKIITSTDDQSFLHFVNLSDVIAGASNESSHQKGGGSHGFSQR